MGRKSRMKWAMREQEGYSDRAADLMGMLEAALAIALEVGAKKRDPKLCVTIWTAKAEPTESDREQLHAYMQQQHQAGFVGTIGWGLAASP